MDPNAETLGAPGWSGPTPERVGAYRVLGVLGEGGFGIVYEAEQTEPVRRRVALKLVKPGMDSAAVLARFDAERQALAVMDHPCIARVFDGGVTGPEQGSRPYFVMELVKGEPLTAHCDRQRLGLDERVRLFVRVCEAVQHAHSKGVIHRDLKPSNILVAYDAEGRATPKVIDFGIAKALTQKLGERTVYTERGQLIGTPEYMSPEQAEMSGQDIDTRADVYSLGVVLYELLTGVLPFDSRTLRSLAVPGVQRMIRDQTPVRPSARLSAIAKAPESHPNTPKSVLELADREPERVPADPEAIASARRTDSRSLRRTLRRDLDWVVMRCLEKDRERRYPTPSALAADLARYLEGAPVEAGPPTWHRRAGTFARRHRVVIGAGSVVALALVGATAVSVWFALSENRQRAIAEDATQTATVNEARAVETVSFLKDILTSIDPDQARGMDTALLRSILDDASRRVESSLDQAPLVEAELRGTIADSYAAIGDYSASLAHYRAARDLLAAQLGADDERTLDVERRLGVALYQLQDFDGARPLLECVRDRLTALAGPEARATIRVRADLASLLESEGRRDEAERAYRDLLAISERVDGADAPETLAIRNNLGYLLAEAGRLDEARVELERTIEGFRRTAGPDSTATLLAMANYAGVLRDSGHTDLAAAPTLEVLELCRRVLDPDHPIRLSALNNAAMMLIDLGRPDEAEADLREALGGLQRRLGPAHPMTLTTEHNLGYLLQTQGRLEDARALVVGAAEGRLRALGPADADTFISVNNAGALLVELGRGERALAMYRTVAEACASAYGPDDPRTLSARHNLGWLLRKIGRAPEAAEVLAPTFAARERVLGPDDAQTLYTQYNLAAALLDAGRTDEAARVAADCLERNRRVYGPDDEETKYAEDLLVQCAATPGG